MQEWDALETVYVRLATGETEEGQKPGFNRLVSALKFYADEQRTREREY